MFGCRKKMSAIAVLNPSGAEALYSRMHSLAAEGRQEYARVNGEVSAPSRLHALQHTSSMLSVQLQAS